MHCYNQAAITLPIHSEKAPKVLTLKGVSLSAVKKLLVENVLHKLRESALRETERDVQLEHCSVLNVENSEDVFTLISTLTLQQSLAHHNKKNSQVSLLASIVCPFLSLRLLRQ